jgi:hypothetical protein
MCHAATKGFDSLMAVRFFLGVGEAVIGPGFALSIGMFYTREEQPARCVPFPCLFPSLAPSLTSSIPSPTPNNITGKPPGSSATASPT